MVAKTQVEVLLKNHSNLLEVSLFVATVLIVGIKGGEEVYVEIPVVLVLLNEQSHCLVSVDLAFLGCLKYYHGLEFLVEGPKYFLEGVNYPVVEQTLDLVEHLDTTLIFYKQV